MGTLEVRLTSKVGWTTSRKSSLGITIPKPMVALAGIKNGDEVEWSAIEEKGKVRLVIQRAPK